MTAATLFLWIIPGITLCVALSSLWDWLRFFLVPKFRQRPEDQMFHNFHARIKPIYLELHDYRFFHSPSGIKRPDNRFVGRRFLIDKLVAILQRSHTKSGAYLISGFRGMGKTSLLRRVLAEVAGEHEQPRLVFTYAFWMVIIISLLSLFEWEKIGEAEYNFVLPLILVFLYWYLYRRDTRLPNLRAFYTQVYEFSNNSGAWWRIWMRISWENFKSAVRLLSVGSLLKPRKNGELVLLFFLHLGLLICLAGLIWKYDSNSLESTYWEKWTALMEVWIGGGVLILFLSPVGEVAARQFYYWIKPVQKKDTRQRTPSEVVVDFFREVIDPTRELWKYIRKRINSCHRVSIEISLAQDDLREVDVLRILSNRMLSSYRRITRPFSSVNRFVGLLGTWIIIYILAGGIYFFGHSWGATYAFKEAIRLTTYFPSQSLSMSDTTEANQLYARLTELGDKRYEVNQDILLGYQEALRPYMVRSASSFPSYRLNPVEKGLMFADYFILTRYLGIQKPIALIKFNETIDKGLPLTEGAEAKPLFAIFPLTPDYLFVLFFLLLIFGITRLASRLSAFGIITHAYVIRRLVHLNETIRAEITLEKQGRVGNPKGILSFIHRKQQRIPIAGIRQIEEELIEILKLLDQIPRIAMRPEFIFVFDELDKIQGDLSFGIAEKEASELSSFYAEDEFGLQAASQIRRRKQAIVKILANLKRFFSVAQAKFFFIAGKEMFDAAMADASDRESFISSIFHEVIYVNSFFKDPENRTLSDITGLTEKYVCQFLVPSDGRYEPDLKGYYEYLKHVLIPNPDGDIISRQEARRMGEPNPVDLAAVKRKKVLYALQHFITYLAYRSNGSPKKITKLMEEQIRPVKAETLNNEAKSLLAGRNSKSFYFHFNYLDQYRFGFTNYLFKPFLIAKGRHMRDLSDQMLVSTSFLMDHLFKFHNFGFSWRHLEQTPEIVSINKAPELRKFIGEILVFLGDSHLEEVVFGLFEFKFTYKMANEISLISKISELEAAAFNFTLDESLHLKKHYKRKIHEMRTQLRKTEFKSDKFSFINSLSLLNVYLGDLYFYDKEYEDAALHYLEAKQHLRSIYTGKKPDDLQLITIIRINLRIGLTYEKMKDYGSAFMSYGEMTRTIRMYAQENKEKLAGFGRISPEPDMETHLKAFENIDDPNYAKRIIFEFFRLILQPLLARLYLIEKASSNRISRIDVDRVHKEAEAIFNLIHPLEKPVMRAEFSKRIGDLLFFKNGTLIQNFLDPSIYNRDEETEPQVRAPDMDFLEAIIPLNGLKQPRDYKRPEAAYIHYHASLRNYIRFFNVLNPEEETPASYAPDTGFGDARVDDDLIQLGPQELLQKCLEFYQGTYQDLQNTSKNKDLLVSIGNLLSNMGDTILASLYHGPEREAGILNLEDLTKLFSTRYAEMKNATELGKLLSEPEIRGGNLVIYHYYLSGQYYKRAARYNKYAFQLRKILHLIRNMAYWHANQKDIRRRHAKKEGMPYVDLELFGGKAGREFLRKLRYHIIREALEISDRSGNFTRRQSLYEAERLMDLDIVDEANQAKFDLFIESRIHIPEIKEMVVLIEDIKVFSAKSGETPQAFHHLVNPYTITNHKYVRLLELNFKTNLNEKIFKDSRLKSFLYNSVSYSYVCKVEKLIGQTSLKDGTSKTRFERGVRFIIDVADNKRRRLIFDTIFKGTYPDQVELGLIPECEKVFSKEELKLALLTEAERYERENLIRFWKQEISYINHGKPMWFWRKVANPMDGCRDRPSQLKQALKSLREELDKELVNAIPQKSRSKRVKRKIIDGVSLLDTRLLWTTTLEELTPDNLDSPTNLDILLNQFKSHGDQKGASLLPEKATILHVVQYLISDSLFSLSELIKTARLFDISYMTSHSFLANAHAELADWSRYYHLLRKLELSEIKLTPKWYQPKTMNLKNRLNDLVDEHDTYYFDLGYHYKQAEKHYYLTLEMHNEGVSYQNYVLDRMFFLEDDFNDNLYHFLTAMERYYINSNIIREQIREVKDKARRVELFDYRYHFDFPDERFNSSVLDPEVYDYVEGEDAKGE